MRNRSWIESGRLGANNDLINRGFCRQINSLTGDYLLCYSFGTYVIPREMLEDVGFNWVLQIKIDIAKDAANATKNT